MKNKNFINKKFGIWGFGVVGKSALQYLNQYSKYIQILDKQQLDYANSLVQNDANISLFLNNNDYILASPGIPLHNYEKYNHKLITELDIFAQEFTGSTIAITGTLGKTSITNLLAQYTPHAIAAGNIGYAMLNVLTQKHQPQKAILELSSFQLQNVQDFAPDIAIWTNFYQNHLDHHKSEQEYFLAKCNLLKNQTNKQIALLPCNLIPKIKEYITINAQIFACCTQNCTTHTYPTFQINQNNIIIDQNNQTTTLFENINTLPPYTFPANWLIVIAALYLQNIPLTTVLNHTNVPKPQEHRLEKLGIYQETTFYNDSKSTVWQATQQALQTLIGQSCALFLGGLSKGADRTPLIQYLQSKPITVFAFGKEAEIILDLCNQHHVPCQSHKTLQEALDACLKQPLPQNILFSPAGASFDLFKNYIERGNYFKTLFRSLISSQKRPLPLLKY